MPAEAARWRFGDQVEAIIASFQLSAREQQLACELVVELTRSLCLRLKAVQMDPPNGVAATRAELRRESG